MKGRILGTDPERNQVLLKHEAIPGVMRAMTMPCNVDPKILPGLKRDQDVLPGESIAPQTAQRMNRMIIAVLALAISRARRLLVRSVAEGAAARDLSRFFDPAWNYLNAQSPQWEDGRYDPYPWAILGYTAAMRGLRAQATTQQASIEKLFTANRGLVTINELGFYQRTKSVLAGTAAV